MTALTSCDGLAEQAVQVPPEAHTVLADIVDLLDLGQNLALTHDKGVQAASHPACNRAQVRKGPSGMSLAAGRVPMQGNQATLTVRCCSHLSK